MWSSLAVPFVAVVGRRASPLFCVLVAVLLPASLADDHEWLTVIYTSDIQSHFDESGASPKACSVGAYCYGGVPRLVKLVRDERAKGGKVLVLDAGGLFNTALLGNPSAPEVLSDLVRLIGYDAMSLGQPELMGDLAALERYMALVGGPFVCTGGLVPPTNTSAPASPCNTSLLLTVGDLKVGVVSFLSPDIPEFQFNPPPSEMQSKDLKLVTEEIGRLRQQGARLVIALVYTSWMAVSIQLTDITHALTGVDLLVVGNSGHLFHNGEAPHGEVVHGPHPAQWKRPGGGAPLLTVSAHNMLHYAGYVRLKVAPGGGCSDWAGDNPRLLAGDKDAAAEAVMARLRPSQDALLGGLVARSMYLLEGGAYCRTGECVLGTTIADAMLEATIQPEYKGEDILAWTRAGSVIYQGWVVQSGISAGLVREEDVRVALPLTDHLVIVSVLGRLLVSLLENAIRYDLYKGLQMSGLRIGIEPDPDNEGHMRVHSLKVLCTVCQMPAFKNINHRYTYRLVSTESCVNTVLSEISGGLQYERLNITLKDATRKLMRKASPMARPREERISVRMLQHHHVTAAAPRARLSAPGVTAAVLGAALFIYVS